MQENEISTLLNCYKIRHDLISTYPEVEFGNFQALINWAAAVCNKRWEDPDYEKLKEYSDWFSEHEKPVSIQERINNCPPLERILEIYHRRPELMSAIYETDFQALINWAAAVCNKRWEDPDYEKLKSFTSWYATHEKQKYKKNSDLTNKALVEIYSSFQKNNQEIIKYKERNNYHTFLEFVTIENSLKKTLELGMHKKQNTTLFLAELASRINGHIWSINNEHSDDIDKIKKHNLNSVFTLLSGEKQKIIKEWNQQINHLVINSNYIFEEDNSYNDLVLLEKFVSTGGFITLHDANFHHKVLEGILEFLKGTNSRFRFYNFQNSNEFCVLRKIQE